MTDKDSHRLPGLAGDDRDHDPLVAGLQDLGSSILAHFGLALDDEGRDGRKPSQNESLDRAFALAVEATRRKLAQLDVGDLDVRAHRLTAAREFVTIFAAADDGAIREQLAGADDRLKSEIIEAVDRVAQPDAAVQLDWSWADPESWHFPTASGRDAYSYGLLLASRAGCVVFFQNKGLAERGFEPVDFAERLVEVREEASLEGILCQMFQAARRFAPAQATHWN